MSIYKLYKENEVTPQRGRRPSTLRTKVDRTLAAMNNGESFTVWNRANMTTQDLQKRLSTYACIYQDHNYGKIFTTKSYKHGVKVTRVR